MKVRNLLCGAAAAAVALALAGCGTTQVTTSPGADYAGGLPRPEQILVRPFAASPGDVKVHMGLEDQLRGNTTPSDRTDKEIEVGNKLAWETAKELAKRIQAMGLPAAVSERPMDEDVRALVIDGALVSVDEGNETERQVIGLSAGRTKLNLEVRVFDVMPEGRRLVDQFQVDATGGWKPGAAEMTAVGIAMDTNPALLILSNVGTGVASEKLSAGIDATARHAADRTARVLSSFFMQHGWLR